MIAALVLAGCHRQAPAGVRTVTDGIGRAVTLGHVKRIVSLAPSSTEIAFALGAGDELVGVDRYSDYPPAARQIQQVGTDMADDLERLVALHPDVVLLATTANAQRSLDTMGAAGLNVYVSRADSLEGIFADITALGRVLERAKEADALVASLRARVGTAPASLVSCAMIVWPSPLVVAGPGSHVGDLLRAAGCANVAGDASQPYPTYSTERLVKKAPQVLFVGTHAEGTPPLASIDALTSIPAVRDHRVYLVDGDLLFRPGPRVVDGIEKLRGLLGATR